jgi:hypothetical protein
MHGAVKFEILVPNNCSVNEYVRRIGNFESEIMAIVKSNQGQYDVWFRSAGNVRLLSFRMLHLCKLNQKRQKRKVVACENYDLKNQRNVVGDITYSKAPNGPKNELSNEANPFSKNEEVGIS